MSCATLAALRGLAALRRVALWFAIAAVPAWVEAAAPRLPADAVDRGWGGHLRLNGIDMDVRLFTLPDAPLVAAAGVLRQAGVDAWLLPMPDGVMLSGADGGRPWLMQLRQSGASHSEGLYAIARGGRHARPAPAAWMPDGGELLLDVASMDDGREVVQQVYEFPDGASALARLLDTRLLAQGWRRVGAMRAVSEWQRAGRVLQLVVVERPVGSGLLTVETSIGADGWEQP